MSRLKTEDSFLLLCLKVPTDFAWHTLDERRVVQRADNDDDHL